MPDVLDAPLAATTFDDGYAPSSRRSHFRLTAAAAATLTPLLWSVGAAPPMSGGVEVSARPGLRLASAHHAYTLEERGTPLHNHLHHQHHPQHHQQQPRYNQQHHHHSHQRHHLSTLENLSQSHHLHHHHRSHPLLQRHKVVGGGGGTAAGQGCGIPSGLEPAMRANERWVLLNKETFQEIFDATLHQMTLTPGELLAEKEREAAAASSGLGHLEGDDHPHHEGCSPPSPTTPDGHLRYSRADAALPARCRKRSSADACISGGDQEEPELANFRRISPMTAMAPMESAKTTTSALNDITNDRPGQQQQLQQRYSPLASSTSSLSSPRLTSPGRAVTSPHSPPQAVATSPLPDRENEPLDLSNKRSPPTTTTTTVTTDSTNNEWSSQSPYNNTLPSATSPKYNPPAAGETSDSVPPPYGPTSGGGRGSPPSPPRADSTGPRPASSTSPTLHHNTTTTEHQPPAQRRESSPEGESVRADVKSAPADPRAPSPRGTEAGGGGSLAGVAANSGGGDGEDTRSAASTHPAAGGGGAHSSGSSVSATSQGGSSSNTDTTTTATTKTVLSTEKKQEEEADTSTTEHPQSPNSPVADCNKSPDSSQTAGTSAGGGGSTSHSSSCSTTTSTTRTMITNTSGGHKGHVKPASENWVPLNKATVYDLVEEVMISLGEKQQKEEDQLRSSNSHQHHQPQRAVSGSHKPRQQQTTATMVNNNNNNNTKAPPTTCTNSKEEGSGNATHSGSRRHRCSPPLTLEGTGEGGQHQEANSTRPASTKSQLRDHLSAKWQQQQQQARSGGSSARGTGGETPRPSPYHPDRTQETTQEDQEASGRIPSSGANNNSSALTRRSPVRSLQHPGGMATCGKQSADHASSSSGSSTSSSSTSPTSKAKQQQCWVALNKMVVFNIVDSAMRNSEAEEEGEEDEEGTRRTETQEVSGRVGETNDKRAPTPPNSKNSVDSVDSKSGNSRSGTATSTTTTTTKHTENTTEENSHPSSCGPTSSSQKAMKRQCDNPVKEGEVEGQSAAKRRCTETAPSPPTHPSPASPRRGALAEGHYNTQQQGHGPAGDGSKSSCLEGLLSDADARTSSSRRQPGDAASGTTGTAGAELAAGLEGSKGRKSLHSADFQVAPRYSIDRGRSSPARQLQQEACGKSAAARGTRSPPVGTHPNHSYHSMLSDKSYSAHRVAGGSNGSSGQGRMSSCRGLKVVGETTHADLLSANTKHGVTPVSRQHGGLAPVSPTAADARSSPRLGWVAVSKIDVHNIVDSVVDSMIAGDDLMTSAPPVRRESASPSDVLDSRSSSSPVPSSSASSSPTHQQQLSTVASPVPARDAESSHRAASPKCPSATGPSSPSPSCRLQGDAEKERGSPQPEAEKRSTGRSTPSPAPASPASPRSPVEGTDRCSDAKSSKAFKWKSNLLMRVEEEKIDVTVPEVASPPPQRPTSGRSGKQRDCKSENRSLRSGRRGSRKGMACSSSKLK